MKAGEVSTSGFPRDFNAVLERLAIMRLGKEILILGSLTFVLGFTGGFPRASAAETAPAKKSEHCTRCHEKHAATCAKHCKDCAKESCAKCEHSKGQKECSKCKKCHDKDGEKDAEKTAEKAPAAA